jgi:hypothetical protein
MLSCPTRKGFHWLDSVPAIAGPQTAQTTATSMACFKMRLTYVSPLANRIGLVPQRPGTYAEKLPQSLAVQAVDDARGEIVFDVHAQAEGVDRGAVKLCSHCVQSVRGDDLGPVAVVPFDHAFLIEDVG